MFGVLLVCRLGAGCGSGPPPVSAEDKRQEDTLRLFAGWDAPASVRDLQIHGDPGSEDAVWCRFAVGPEGIDAVLATGYRRIGCDTIEDTMAPPQAPASFSPAWAPADSGAAECYLKTIELGEVSDGMYLSIDRTAGVVYAVRHRFGIMTGR